MVPTDSCMLQMQQNSDKVQANKRTILCHVALERGTPPYTFASQVSDGASWKNLMHNSSFYIHFIEKTRRHLQTATGTDYSGYIPF